MHYMQGSAAGLVASLACCAAAGTRCTDRENETESKREEEIEAEAEEQRARQEEGRAACGQRRQAEAVR